MPERSTLRPRRGSVGRQRWVSLLLGGFLATATAHAQLAAPPLAPPPARLVFRGVTVIDVEGGQRLPNRTVVIVGNRIQSVAPAGRARIPAGARVVDARGKYLIPGLWDMHVHPWDYQEIFFPLLLANGVTGVRDAGSNVPLVTLGRWKQEIAAGTRVGPRLLVSGPSINGTSSNGRCESASHQICIATPAEARLVVSLFKALGADMIKTYYLSPELYFAVAAEARRVGIPFGGHTNDSRPPDEIDGRDASDSGATFLDHQTWFLDDPCGAHSSDSLAVAQCAAAAQRLRRNNTWVTLMGSIDIPARGMARARRYVPASFPWPEGLPLRSGAAITDSQAAAARDPISTAEWANFVTGIHDPTLDTSLHRFSVLHTAGIPILIGTDAVMAPASLTYLWTPGFTVHNALVFFVLGGMTPLEALQTATLNPAKALRATDSLGTVEVGKVADLVLLEADPLVDIWNTTKIRAVIANGRYFDRAALDRLLAQAEQAAAHR